MKTNMKKFLSLLLAFSMVLSLMSVSVFAAEIAELSAENVSTVNAGDTVSAIAEGYTLEEANTALAEKGLTLTVNEGEQTTYTVTAVEPEPEGPTEYTITYAYENASNSIGETLAEIPVQTITAEQIEKGENEITYDSLHRAGYVFTGWLDNATDTVYQAGDLVVPTENMTLTAQWAEVTLAESEADGVDVVHNDTAKEVTVYTANGLKWVADVVNMKVGEWNSFKGWIVKLGADIDLNNELWTAIGNNKQVSSFEGTFDGQNYTVSNFRQNVYCQAAGYIRNPSLYLYYPGYGMYDGGVFGLFGTITDATVKNLVINGAWFFTEAGPIGTVVGEAFGTCTFDKITILNCKLNGYQSGTGGIVGDVYNGASASFNNIEVGETNVLNTNYRSADTPMGGIIGNLWMGSARFENCTVSAQLMPLNDVAANYQWYRYRNSGMLIGLMDSVNSPGDNVGKVAENVTIGENVTVIYGDWNQQRYCEFHEAGHPSYAGSDDWKFFRIDEDDNGNHSATYAREAGTVVVADMEKHFHYDDETHNVLLVFDQLIGGGTGESCLRALSGVNVTYDNTIDHDEYPVWTWANGLTSATARFDEEGTDTATDSDIEIVDGKVFASVEHNGATYTTYAEPYTLSFVDGGTTLQTISAVDGQLPAPNAPSKEGYTFTGWSPALVPVTGNATYTAQFVAVDAANTETGESGETVTTSEGEFEPISETEQQKVDFTVITSEESGVKTEVVEQTTTTGTVAPGADTATYTVTVETTTITTTTDTEGGKTTTAAAGTPETTAVVTLTKTETTTVTNSTELEDSDETVSAIVSATESNVVTTDAVKVAEIAEKLLDMVREDEQFDTENENTTIAVALTLEPTLIEVTTETVDVEGTPTEVVTGITFDVKPMIQATVTVGEVVVDNYITEATDRVVANAQLTGEPITVKLPITGDFVVNSATSISVKHIHDDGTIDVIPGEIKGNESDGYYVEVQVSEFSSFEIVPSNKVYATFDPNYAGSTKSVILYTVGDAITAPTVTRGGYNFAGWSPVVPATATESATYTAQWSAIVYDTGSYTGSNNSPTTTITDEETPLSAFPIFYVDVAEDSWYHDAVAYVTALDLMNGVGDDRFAPNANTTRGMVAVVMMRLAQGEAVDLNSFFDVADDAYYAEAAAWAVENGVYVGYDDGSFRGELNILREQFAAVLYRYATAKGYDVSGKAELGSFTDSASVSGYAADAMAWAVESGIIEGVGDNLLDPLGNATRAQLATMLMRFHALYTAEV